MCDAKVLMFYWKAEELAKALGWSVGTLEDNSIFVNRNDGTLLKVFDTAEAAFGYMLGTKHAHDATIHPSFQPVGEVLQTKRPVARGTQIPNPKAHDIGSGCP